MVATPRDDRLAVPRRVEAGADLGDLAGPDPGRGDLGRLVLDEGDPPLELGGIDRQRLEGGLVRPPGGHGRGHRRPLRVVTAVGVEEVALPALVEEAGLLVLAVDLHEASRRSSPGGRQSPSRRRRGRPSAPIAATSRTQTSGSGSRSKSASTRAASAP